MASRGARLRARRQRNAGRPRIEDAAREPSGRISRSGIPHEPADVVALEARIKHMGVPRSEAKNQKAATFIGYLSILGRRDGISASQYDALVSFLDLRSSYLRAIKAPDSTLSSVPGAGTAGITEAYEDWCRSTVERYGKCRLAIQEAQNQSRSNLWAALDICVVRGERQSHMIPDIRIVGNALARFFGA